MFKNLSMTDQEMQMEESADHRLKVNQTKIMPIKPPIALLGESRPSLNHFFNKFKKVEQEPADLDEIMRGIEHLEPETILQKQTGKSQIEASMIKKAQVIQVLQQRAEEIKETQEPPVKPSFVQSLSTFFTGLLTKKDLTDLKSPEKVEDQTSDGTVHFKFEHESNNSSPRIIFPNSINAMKQGHSANISEVRRAPSLSFDSQSTSRRLDQNKRHGSNFNADSEAPENRLYYVGKPNMN